MQEKLEKICVTVLISVWRRFVKVRLWKTSASRKFTVYVPNERSLCYFGMHVLTNFLTNFFDKFFDEFFDEFFEYFLDCNSNKITHCRTYTRWLFWYYFFAKPLDVSASFGWMPNVSLTWWFCCHIWRKNMAPCQSKCRHPIRRW